MGIYYKSVSFHRINKNRRLRPWPQYPSKQFPLFNQFTIPYKCGMYTTRRAIDPLVDICCPTHRKWRFLYLTWNRNCVGSRSYLNFTLEYRVVCRQSGFLFEIGMYVVHNIKRVVCFSQQSEKINWLAPDIVCSPTWYIWKLVASCGIDHGYPFLIHL